MDLGSGLKRATKLFVVAAAILTCYGDAQAQREKPVEAPLIEIGMLAGRDGAAFGPGILTQLNWNRMGFYGFAGTSHVNGYDAGDGIKADFSDRTLGFGIECRIARITRLIVIGTFGQAAYYGSHVHATYFDSDSSLKVEYVASDRDPLVTIGPEIDFGVMKAMRIVVRPGKDFGNNFAATTAGGFSLDAAVLVDLKGIGTSIGKGFVRVLQ